MAKPTEPKVRELIPTGFLSDFGEARIPKDEGPTEIGVDPTYVEGFSDLRFQRDRELAEAKKGLRPPHKVTTLPVNLRWSRRTDVKGVPTGIKITKAKKNGYQMVTKDDIGQPWLKSLPDGAVIAADGTIQMNDLQLMVCASERAAANQFRQQELTMNQLGASLQKAEDLGMALEKTPQAGVRLGSAVDVTA